MNYTDIQHAYEAGTSFFLVRLSANRMPDVHLTSGDVPVEFEGALHVPTPLQIGEMSSSTTYDDDKLDVSFPIYTSGGAVAPGAAPFFPQPVEAVVSIEIRHASYTDTHQGIIAGARVIYSGRVAASGTDSKIVKLSCTSLLSDVGRHGLRRIYSLDCPHLLYGSECKAVKAHATLTGFLRRWYMGLSFLADASSNVGTLIDQDAHRAKRPLEVNDFIGARIRYGDDHFTVLGGTNVQNGETTTLNSIRFSSVENAKINSLVAHNEIIPVILTMSCARSLGYCHAIHENAPNYGGFPFIPSENPIGRSFYAQR